MQRAVGILVFVFILEACYGAIDSDISQYHAYMVMTGEVSVPANDPLGPFLVPIPPERNSSDEHSKAMDFYNSHFGLDFANGATPQGLSLLISDASVYDNIDMANIQYFPPAVNLQDLLIKDSQWSLIAPKDFLAYGVYGGPNGTWIKQGTFITTGFYYLYWRQNNSLAFPRIQYWSQRPMPFGNNILVGCTLFSKLWGNGFARSLTNVHFDNATGTLIYRLRNMLSFPAMTTVKLPKCATLMLPKRVQNDNIVSRWFQVLLAAIREAKPTPVLAARSFAILGKTIYNTLDSNCQPRNRCSPQLTTTLISYSAHRVLNWLYPSQQGCFEAALFRALEGIPSSVIQSAKQSAVRIALGVIFARQNDGAADYIPYTISENNPSAWKPTFPDWQFIPIGVHFANIEPFAISDPADFDQGPPPTLGSVQYQQDLAEVLSLGYNNSATRTYDQEVIALFWNGSPGTMTPPGHWFLILQQLLRIDNITDTFKIARAHNVLGAALADAGFVAWYHKYKYNTLRPETAARQNNRTTDWFPFLATPPFPEYISGHSTFSAAGSKALALIFGTDDKPFTINGENAPGKLRSFTKLSDAAKECGRSRIYGGIHFQYANNKGYSAGTTVAQAVFNALCNSSPCI